MNDELISVVIATYNHAQYLPTALDSILNQSWENLEVVIVDNASTDHTQELASSLIKKDKQRVRYIRNDTNLQKATSVNKALSTCKGKYYALNDADDASHPLRLEKQIKASKLYSSMHVMTQGCPFDSNLTLEQLQSSFFKKEFPVGNIVPKEKTYEIILSIRDNQDINWFPVPNDHEGAHGVSPLTLMETWTNGIRFHPSNMYLRMKPRQGEDSDINTRITLLLKSTIVMLEPLYFHRQHTSTNTDYQPS